MKKIHSQYPLEVSGRDFSKVQEIIDRLHKIPRTGWIDRGVKNPENVGEHTDAVVALSEKYFKIAGLSLMLKIHEWAKSNPSIGDRRTDRLCPKKIRQSKKKKFQKEFRAMREICLSFKNITMANELFSLWLEYAQKKTERAIIANQLDKLQAMQRAVEYQKQERLANAQEFIDSYEKIIKHFILRPELEDLKEELQKIKQASVGGLYET